jgi:hypothetical protein
MSKRYKYFLKSGDIKYEFPNRQMLVSYIKSNLNNNFTQNQLDNYFLNRLRSVPEFFNNINRIRI